MIRKAKEIVRRLVKLYPNTYVSLNIEIGNYTKAQASNKIGLYIQGVIAWEYFEEIENLITFVNTHFNLNPLIKHGAQSKLQ